MGFAIDRNHVAMNLLDGLHPGHEAVLKLGRVNPGKHPAKGVVGRNPVGQIEKWVEPHLFESAKFGDGDPASGPTDDRRERNHDDVKQRMVAGALLPGIIDGGKIRPNGKIKEQGHGILQHSTKTDPSCRKRPTIVTI